MSLNIEGERIYLRQLIETDANDTYLGWLNDPEVNRYLESRHKKQALKGLRAYIKETISEPANLFLAIVLKSNNRHIGNIKLGPIDNNHRLGDIGLIIGEKDCWGKGYATEAISLLVNYAFKQLGLHKLTAGCYANNEGSAKAFIKAGFTDEGRLKSQYYCDGGYVDRICLGVINPEERE